MLQSSEIGSRSLLLPSSIPTLTKFLPTKQVAYAIMGGHLTR